MSLRTAVVVLLVIIVLAVLVIFFGAVRPTVRPPDAGRGSVESALGWLRSRDTVTFEELARSQPGCDDRATGTFVVAPGATCAVDLPDGGSFTLCAGEGVDAARAVVDGADFPAGTFAGRDDLGCAEPALVDVYDQDMVLTLVCGPTVPPTEVPCRFGVGEPRD